MVDSNTTHEYAAEHIQMATPQPSLLNMEGGNTSLRLAVFNNATKLSAANHNAVLNDATQLSALNR
eukprot:12921832-Prorocentrum_lima.AAC.1